MGICCFVADTGLVWRYIQICVSYSRFITFLFGHFLSYPPPPTFALRHTRKLLWFWLVSRDLALCLYLCRFLCVSLVRNLRTLLWVHVIPYHQYIGMGSQ